ncbi:hypothetical protein D9M71_568010 [compost metagenome]
MQHVGGFAGVHRPLAVRADRHAFGLYTDVDLRQHLLAVDVDHGDQRIVLVGDVQPLVVGMQGELLGVGAGGQLLDDLAGGQVHHLHAVGVAGADVQQLVVAGQGQAARAHANLESLHRFQLVEVDHADAVVLLVGHVGGGGEGRVAGEQEAGGAGGKEQVAHGSGSPNRCCCRVPAVQVSPFSRQRLSGRS